MNNRKRQGFASLPKRQRKLIARQGGAASAESDSHNKFDSNSARKAVLARWAKVAAEKELYANSSKDSGNKEVGSEPQDAEAVGDYPGSA